MDNIFWTYVILYISTEISDIVYLYFDTVQLSTTCKSVAELVPSFIWLGSTHEKFAVYTKPWLLTLVIALTH